MTAYVLMCKRTANLLVGYRITFMDNFPSEMIGGLYSLTDLRHDGWIVNTPVAGGFSIFMNVKWVENNFEVLGEI